MAPRPWCANLQLRQVAEQEFEQRGQFSGHEVFQAWMVIFLNFLKHWNVFFLHVLAGSKAINIL